MGILYPDYGESFTVVYIYVKTIKWHPLKYVQFIICQLYLNKENI